MKIFRKEHFGGILYDTNSLRFDLVGSMPKDVKVDRIIETELPERKDIISAPVRVYYELLRRCNLACRHCFVSSTKYSEYGQSTDEIKAIIDELHASGVIDLRFTGGEVTVRKDFFDILRHTKDREFSISLNTNGVYADPDYVTNQFAELNLEQITVSLDGLRDSHDYLRGKNSFDKTMESLKLMKEKGIKTRINTVINKRNYKQIPELVEIASQYTKEINFFFMRPIGRAIKHNFLSLDFDEHYESAKVAIGLRQQYPELSIMHFEQSFTERSIDKFAEDLQQGYPYGNTTLNLDWKGNVWAHGYSTYQDDRFNLGNLHETPLRKIWAESPKLESMRQWYRQLIKRCHGCDEHKKRCAGYNFEMEVAKSLGNIETNPFCVNETPVPLLNLEGYTLRILK